MRNPDYITYMGLKLWSFRPAVMVGRIRREPKCLSDATAKGTLVHIINREGESLCGKNPKPLSKGWRGTTRVATCTQCVNTLYKIRLEHEANFRREHETF